MVNLYSQKNGFCVFDNSELVNFAKSLAPDFASFNIATPFPGTYFRDWAIKNGYLANESNEALDSTTYTLVTPSLPPGTVEKYCNKAFRSFYYSPGYILRRLRHIRDTEDIIRYVKSAFYAFKAIPSIFGTTWQKNKYKCRKNQ